MTNNTITNATAIAVLQETSLALTKVTQALTRVATAVETLAHHIPQILESRSGSGNPVNYGHGMMAAASSLESHIADLTAGLGGASTGYQPSVCATSAAVGTTSFGVPTHGLSGQSAARVLTPSQLEARISHLPNEGTYYVVIRGIEPGIYTTATEAQSHVRGVANAMMEKKNPKVEAFRFYCDKFAQGEVVRCV